MLVADILLKESLPRCFISTDQKLVMREHLSHGICLYKGFAKVFRTLLLSNAIKLSYY